MSKKKQADKLDLMHYATWIAGTAGRYQTIEELSEIKAGLKLSDAEVEELWQIICEIRLINHAVDSAPEEIPYTHCAATKAREVVNA